MDEPGKIATITIHDLNGRTVRTLAQNETLATSGSFIWDGTSDQGQQVRLGVYLVIMEVYSMAGDIELYKERVAVSRNF
jgi:flagellar hook assembly protein FlgD